MANLTVKNYYNQVVRDKLRYDYEHHRWFKDAVSRGAYKMTLGAIEQNLPFLNFDNYLELGPGPGTWTELFVQLKPTASFDLVDISTEMLSLARRRFSQFNNINYWEVDFMDFAAEKKYDLFFSSRALEYLTDKEKAVEKIMSLLRPGGLGIIITKYPKYGRSKLLRRRIKPLHQHQISPARLSYLLQKYGAIDIQLSPVVMYFPILHSAFLNRLVYFLGRKRKLNSFWGLFTESYIIKFKKG